MDFQKIKTVEDYKFYLDIAFGRAKKASDEMRDQNLKGTRLDKSKKIEIARIDKVNETIKEHFSSIIKSFPAIDDMPEFYKELIKSTMEYKELKKSLAALNWAKNKTAFFYDKYKMMIKRTNHLESINTYRRDFYGRISSVIKQVKSNLNFLKEARKMFRDYPNIKDGYKTVAIFGFPNVGKSTLLSKLSSSKPEIAPYPFTTKKINVGYLKKGNTHIQLLDTPGTLDRFEKMNSIEKQAYLAIKYCADEIIFIFDVTEPFPLRKQEELLEHIEKFRKPILIYLSKTDVIDPNTAKTLKEKYEILSFEEIVEKV